MTEEDANLLHYMPIIVRSSGITEWERSFCASIIARSRRSAFTPSDRQRRTMRGIVRAFKERALRDDDVTEAAEDRAA